MDISYCWREKRRDLARAGAQLCTSVLPRGNFRRFAPQPTLRIVYHSNGTARQHTTSSACKFQIGQNPGLFFSLAISILEVHLMFSKQKLPNSCETWTAQCLQFSEERKRTIYEPHWNHTPAPADELQSPMAWRNCSKGDWIYTNKPPLFIKTPLFIGNYESPITFTAVSLSHSRLQLIRWSWCVVPVRFVNCPFSLSRTVTV
ncbi:hypothetical protein J6590_082265 [Homalodisca vitripennis]|nr:hypothetical protein J6590_082265 [Homalodisca vitripennis]